jgi:glycosyltransferase involved in cell wall biosynthesis
MKAPVIGVVVPAHNEQRVIARCLAAIDEAVRTLGRGARVHVVVVCDACSDRTAEIVADRGHRAVVCRARNVGIARGLGAEAALAAGAQWLAFTDADTRVAPDWLWAQLALGSDVVCGTIDVDDWSEHGDGMRRHFEATYRDADGHRHIHGANLGMTAAAYRSVGGFAELENSEDVAIVRALEDSGARIAWSASPRVVTSARKDFRATAGFGATLISVASTMVARPSRSMTPHDGGGITTT